MAHLETPPDAWERGDLTNGRWAGYWHLLGARMKELWREPEVIFWVFVFPCFWPSDSVLHFAISPPTSPGSRWQRTHTRNK